MLWIVYASYATCECSWQVVRSVHLSKDGAAGEVDRLNEEEPSTEDGPFFDFEEIEPKP